MAPLLQKLCAFVVVLAVAVSLTAGASAWGMSGDMASAMADVSSPTCDEGDCPDHDMAGAACYAACSGTLAVLSTSIGAHLWSNQGRDPLAMPVRIGQTSPPDPSPPRPSVLS